jgi:hypothetical protein
MRWNGGPAPSVALTSLAVSFNAAADAANCAVRNVEYFIAAAL